MTNEQVMDLNDTLSRFVAEHGLDVSDDRLDEAVWSVVSIVEKEDD